MNLEHPDSEAFAQAIINFQAHFKNRLSKPVLQEFEFTTLAELKRSLNSIEQSQNSGRKLRNMRRLSKFLEAMEALDEVVHVFLNSTKYLGFVWGPVKLLLVVSRNHVEAYDALLDTYDKIGRVMPLLKGYEKLAQDSNVFRGAIVEVYEVILEFHIKAVRYFQSGSWKKLFHASWSTFMTQFKPYMAKLESIKTCIEQHALLQHMSHFERHVQDFKTLRVEEAKRFEHQIQLEKDERARRTTERRDFLQRWLIADRQGDQDQDHAGYSQKRETIPSSGSWILQKTEFQDWVDAQQNHKALLWMTGKPGTGKTVLASLISDYCEQQCQSMAGMQTARYYCKYGTSTRDDFFAMARSLIWQLVRNDDSLLEWLYEQASWCGLSTLFTNDKLCKDILATVLSSFTTVYVVVDGIDECRVNEDEDINEPRKIEEFFRTLCQTEGASTASPVRCLFVSQHDGVCGRVFFKHPRLVVAESDIEADIRLFVARQITAVQDRFELDNDTANELLERLTEHSEGMFLYTKLVLHNLERQPDLERLQAEVNNPLPRGIDGAYDRIMRRIIIDGDSEHNERLLKVLGIVATARRPLKWREVRGALATVIETRHADLRMHGLRGTIKEYCSSFIEERANGDIHFVHQTARSYIAREPKVKLDSQHLNLAQTCVALLTGQGFDDALTMDESKIRKHIWSGCYSFATYAVAFWASHVGECLQLWAEHPEVDALSKLLVAFLEHNFSSPHNPVVIEESFQRLSHTLSASWPRLKDIQMAMSATARQLHSNGPGSATNEVLCLPQKLKNVHATIESLRGTTGDKLCCYYGTTIFKCPRMSCIFFSEGFASAAARDAHLAKHEKPFRCTFATCFRADDGFKSKRELRNHLSAMHNEPWLEDAFPSREDFDLSGQQDDEEPEAMAASKAPTKHVCAHCLQTFTRNHSLRVHVASKHAGERRYQCHSCGISFAKSGDLKRHDANIHKGQKPYVCRGIYGEPFDEEAWRRGHRFNSETWGCGLRFDRAYRWSAHFTRSSKTDGSDSCISPLLSRARGQSNAYTCQGPLWSVQHGKGKWGCGFHFNSARELLKHWQEPDGREVCLKLILEPEPTEIIADADATHIREEVEEANPSHADKKEDSVKSAVSSPRRELASGGFESDQEHSRRSEVVGSGSVSPQSHHRVAEQTPHRSVIPPTDFHLRSHAKGKRKARPLHDSELFSLELPRKRFIRNSKRHKKDSTGG